MKTIISSVLLNKKFILTSIFLLSLFFGTPAHAQIDCDMSRWRPEAGPPPSQIVCPFIRLINLVLFLSGVAFIVFVGYGAIKLAVSLGDPKGFQGAQKTWMYAVIGFLIILFSFAIVGILNRTFGFGINILNSPQALSNSIQVWFVDTLHRRFLIFEPPH